MRNRTRSNSTFRVAEFSGGRDAAGVEFGSDGKSIRVDIRVVVALVLLVVLPVAAVGALFVWGAIKDGEADKALQKRLGIRRKTRLGR